MELGTVGSAELIFFFLIVILVVGPRRIVRGWQRIMEWVSTGFRRAGRSKTAKQSQRLLRGLGSMTAYYKNAGKAQKGENTSRESGE